MSKTVAEEAARSASDKVETVAKKVETEQTNQNQPAGDLQVELILSKERNLVGSLPSH
jgi:hypothetical protein